MSNPKVKAKAELYLKAHLDTYRNKHVLQHRHHSTTTLDNTVRDNTTGPMATVGGGTNTITANVNVTLLNNPLTLAQSLLAWSLGSPAALHTTNAVIVQYHTRPRRWYTRVWA